MWRPEWPRRRQGQPVLSWALCHHLAAAYSICQAQGAVAAVSNAGDEGSEAERQRIQGQKSLRGTDRRARRDSEGRTNRPGEAQWHGQTGARKSEAGMGGTLENRIRQSNTF